MRKLRRVLGRLGHHGFHSIHGDAARRWGLKNPVGVIQYSLPLVKLQVVHQQALQATELGEAGKVLPAARAGFVRVGRAFRVLWEMRRTASPTFERHRRCRGPAMG